MVEDYRRAQRFERRGVPETNQAFAQIRKYDELRQRPNQDLEDASVLLEYLPLFDEMYFCEALGDRVCVEVAPRGFVRLEDTDFGDFWSHRAGSLWTPRPEFEGRIRIVNLACKEKYSDLDVWFHHYLRTLLQRLAMRCLSFKYVTSIGFAGYGNEDA